MDSIFDHQSRVGSIVRILALDVGYGETVVEEIVRGAEVHDTGKSLVNQTILNKSGKLTDSERSEIERHSALGATILNRLGYPKMSVDIALYHHEKWDGTGYPKGLSGNYIPREAQLVSICDVYDALRSDRCYRKGMSHFETVRIMTGMFGTHFNPKWKPFFLRCVSTFESQIYSASDIAA